MFLSSTCKVRFRRVYYIWAPVAQISRAHTTALPTIEHPRFKIVLAGIPRGCQVQQVGLTSNMHSRIHLYKLRTIACAWCRLDRNKTSLYMFLEINILPRITLFCWSFVFSSHSNDLNLPGCSCYFSLQWYDHLEQLKYQINSFILRNLTNFRVVDCAHVNILSLEVLPWTTNGWLFPNTFFFLRKKHERLGDVLL